MRMDVKELLPCFLFKQFTTDIGAELQECGMSKSYYRVSFLSNSQLDLHLYIGLLDVKELLPCFLFKQFTTGLTMATYNIWMSKSYYRVSFLSNSQLSMIIKFKGVKMSKSYYRVSFLSNSQPFRMKFTVKGDVKELLPCFLFKQFTTLRCFCY